MSYFMHPSIPNRSISLPFDRLIRQTLPNGLVMLLLEEHMQPMITLKMIIKSGSYNDPADKEGLSNLLIEMIPQGTKKRDHIRLNEEIEYCGARLSAYCNPDYCDLTLTFLKKDLDRAMALFGEMLLDPSFPETELNKKITSIKGALKAEQDDPQAAAAKAFIETLFRGHPYGHVTKGTEVSLERLRRADLLRHYKRYFRPHNCILVAVGDFDARNLASRCERIFGTWDGGDRISSSDLPPIASRKETVIIDRDVSQTSVIMGQPSIPRSHPDYHAFSVMNYILGGGGFSSRILEEIRTKRGLAYSAASLLDARLRGGLFKICFQTKNDKVHEAVALALGEVQRIRHVPVDNEELRVAKRYLIGSFPLRLSTNAQIAAFLGALEVHGLGLDYPRRYPQLIRSVTRRAVTEVAERTIDPGSWVFVAVTKKDRFEIPPVLRG